SSLLSRGSGPASYPAKPLVSFRTYRQLSGWNPPPLMIRALRAHCHEATFGGALLDHLVGHGEECRAHGDAQRLRGLEVDGEREFGRLHDRQVTGILT